MDEQNTDNESDRNKKNSKKIKHITVESFIKQKCEATISSLTSEIKTFGSTYYMFFDVEYFNNGTQQVFMPGKKKYYPFQFTLMNYFGNVCINEWIRYEFTDLPKEAWNNYQCLLNQLKIQYESTGPPFFLQSKIEFYMRDSKYLVGYGINEDYNSLRDVIKIDLNCYKIADLSRHIGFGQVDRSSKEKYPERLKNLAQIFVEKMIQERKGFHDSCSDSDAIRRLFILEKGNINLKDLQFNKWK